jgi:hypothetical protein
MSRPRKPIDAEQVRKLAELGCTHEEIADVVGCSRHTLERRFAPELSRARACLNMSLRRAQMHQALRRRSVAMLIHLGKVYLGQRAGTSQDDLRAILSGLVAPTPDPPASTTPVE